MRETAGVTPHPDLNTCLTCIAQSSPFAKGFQTKQNKQFLSKQTNKKQQKTKIIKWAQY